MALSRLGILSISFIPTYFENKESPYHLLFKYNKK